MKTQKKYDLKSLPIDKKDFRKAFHYIHKYNENTVEMTDGHILARVPAEEIEGEFYLPSINYKDISNKDYLIYPPVTENVPEQYPKTDEVIPNKEEIVFTIGVNAKLLYSLSKILGDDLVELGIISETKAIHVQPHDEDNKAFGLIMPIRIENNSNKLEELEENNSFMNWLKTQEVYSELIKKYKENTTN